MLLNTLLLALRSIRRNLLRSFLTILGIVIGVSAVITMVTLGRGATQAVQRQISSLGSNLLMVRPGQRLGPGGGSGGAPAFKEADADDDAEDGQERAQQVAADRAQRDEQGIEQHQQLPAVAASGRVGLALASSLAMWPSTKCTRRRA